MKTKFFNSLSPLSFRRGVGVRLLFVLFLSLPFGALWAQTVRYVAPAGTGDGSSWSSASGNLQFMINLSSADDQVWVAAGTYTPQNKTAATDNSGTPTTSRDQAFVLVNGVQLYGGFTADVAGTTAPAFGTEGRDGISVLSGDLNSNDKPGNFDTNRTDNAYHVVIAASTATNGTAVLDGFTITGGQTSNNGSTSMNGKDIERKRGGGIYANNASLALVNLTVNGNQAVDDDGTGGGIFNTGSSTVTLTDVTVCGNRAHHGSGIHITGSASLTLTRVTLSGNNTDRFGGGIFIEDGSCTMTEVTATGNTAEQGGGINNWGTLVMTGGTVTGNEISSGSGGGIHSQGAATITNVLITGNTASGAGGGIAFSGEGRPALTSVTVSGNKANNAGGGIVNLESAFPVLTNVVISGNQAANGGGMANVGSENGDASNAITATNVTVSGNLATGQGGGLYDEGTYKEPTTPPFVLVNTLVWGNSGNSGNNMSLNNTQRLPIAASYTLVQGETLDGDGNLNGEDQNTDPQFAQWINPADADWQPTTAGDYRLKKSSPAIGAGDNSAYLAARGIIDFPGETDAAGNPRLAGDALDLGAYEYQIAPNAGGVVYVKDGGDGDGSSWANACGNLADPLLLAQTSAAITQIWVAAGTYTPLHKAGSGTHTRDQAFVLVPGVGLYGGFPAEANDTDHNSIDVARTGVTVLSGDIDGMPGLSDGDAYHVVIAAGTCTGKACLSLDGFTVTGGNANGSSGSGGITVNGQAVFRYNGGGIYNYNASPVLTNVTVSGNSAGSSGGGIFNYYASPVLVNVTASSNTAGYGGGGIFNNNASPVLTNVTISGNSAGYGGGGIFNNNASPVLTNTIVWGNTATIDMNVYNDGSTPSYSHSLVQGETLDGDGNLDGTDEGTDPQFADAANGDYRLAAASPVIDRGNDAAYLAARSIESFANETDAAGNPRRFGEHVDLGAYEYCPLQPSANGIVYVKDGGTGDGSSWNSAYGNLADPLQAAQTRRAGIRQIRVAAGTYTPLYKAADTDGDGNPTTSRNRAFVLVSGVGLYGGFPAEANDTDHNSIDVARTGVTVLSGDLNDDDTPDDFDNNRTDNAYHVVIAAGIPATDGTGKASLALDGFTVTGGNANGGGSITVNGRGIYQDSGGGIYNVGASPVLTHITVSGNTAIQGGGISNNGGASTLTNVVISGNQATMGGGILNNNYSAPALVNVTVTGNTAQNSGGGICNDNHSAPTLTNTLVWGNTANNDTDNVLNIDNGTPTYSYSLVQDEALTGDGNLDGTDEGNSPQFVNAAGGDYRPAAASPVIDRGDNSAYLSARGISSFDGETDLAGNPRLYRSTIDLGACEFVPHLHPDPNGTIYVKTGGAGNFDGSSWANAYGNLADPLWEAGTNAAIRQIWVAEGTYTPLYRAAETYTDYTPQPTTSRDKAFVLVAGVQLYGGFPANANDTDHATLDVARTAPTVLSGDIDGDDEPGNFDNNRTDNAYHVVIAASTATNGTAVLDGFTITGGNANGDSWVNIIVNGQYIPRNHGGGMYNYQAALTLADLTVSGNTAIQGGGIYNAAPATLTRVTVSENRASTDGGGIYSADYSYTMTASTVSGNTAGNYGGGIYNYYGAPVLTNAVISGNTAEYGGGIYNYYGAPVLTNAVISGNEATYGGGIYTNDNTTLINALVSGNKATGNGGGMYIYSYRTYPHTLVNTTVSGNQAGDTGGGIYNAAGSAAILTNIVVWGNSATTGANVYNNNGTPTYSYSLVQGEDLTGAGTGNLNGADASNNPQFAAPADATNAPTTAGDYRLQAISPAIDAGDNSAYLAARGIIDFTDETDLGGNPRSCNNSIDIGAYEYPPAPSIEGIMYVKAGGDGNRDGSSWANAYPNVADPLWMAQTNPAITQIWVAGGTYYPRHRAGNGTTTRDQAFVLVPGVQLYGGFPADANNTDHSSIDVARTAPTILSGDLDGSESLSNDDAYHVVIAAGIDDNGETVVDGFTLTGGNANGSGSINVNGRDIPRNAGGGMISREASPVLTRITVNGNRAAGSGGGIANMESPSLTLTNAVIYGNRAAGSGGGIANANASPILTNVTVSGNQATTGGGIANTAGSAATLTNTLVWGNGAATGANVHNDAAAPSYSHSLVQGEALTGAGNLDGTLAANDPLFTVPVIAEAAPTTAGSYCLKVGSPAIGAGSNGAFPSLSTATDLAGHARLSGTTVDLGAYEYDMQPFTDAGKLAYSLAPVVYTGEPQPVTVTPEAGMTGLGSIEVLYNNSATAPTDAGTYIIAVDIGEGRGYAATGLELGTYTIAPATVTVQWGNTALTYTGEPQAPAATATGVNDEDLPLTVNGEETGVGTGYNAVATLDPANDNYILTGDTQAFDIVPKPNTNVSSIEVNNAEETDTDFYLANCGTDEVAITITPEQPGATVLYNGAEVASILLDVSRPDIYTVAYEVVTGADDRATYTLQVESRFAFDAITEVKYNNVLYVNNNPANNGGYRFTAYEWYRNGQPVGTGQYYTAGSARSDMLDASAQYGLTLTTIDGKVMHTCLSATIRPETAPALVVYPNPVYRGATATLEYPALSDNTVVRIYTLTGQLIRTQKLTGSRTVLSLPPTFGLYLVTVNGETVTILVE